MSPTKFVLRFGILGLTLYLCSIYLGEGWHITDIEKPFVYRQLVPLLSLCISTILGVSETTATQIVVVLSTIGLVESSRYLYNSIYPQSIRTDMFVLLHVCLAFLFAMFPIHTYDIPTVFLFTWCLGLIKSFKVRTYLVVFPFVVLNRETAFLLIILFAVFFWGRLNHKVVGALTASQVALYLSIQFIVRYIFRDAPGTETTITFVNFVTSATGKYFIVFSHMLIGLLTISLIHSKWYLLPHFLRDAVVIFLPVLTTLYFMFGYPFELRVFLEVLPVITLIGVQNGKELRFNEGTPDATTTGV